MALAERRLATPMLATHFAPAEREDPDRLEAQRQHVRSETLVPEMLAAFPEPAVILNPARQILVANERMAWLLGRPEEGLLGFRIGEVLRCEHAHEEPNGCGTTRFCRNCGAARATVRCSATGRPGAEECRIVRGPGLDLPALDLLVWTTPLEIRGERFLVFALRDTADEKRRAVLERIFFHDVLNAAGGLQGLIALLPESTSEERVELIEMAHQLSTQLVEEIEAQRDLAAAERGELRTEFRDIDANAFLARLRAACVGHPAAVGKHIVTDEIVGKPRFVSDEVVLRRVLGNLLKNALEASMDGGTVRIGFRQVEGPCLYVHNATTMTDAVRDQIFQRSFTTKRGSGRGVGTYSIKLLTERYLRGTVSFITEPAAGTTFTVALPTDIADGPAAVCSPPRQPGNGSSASGIR